MKKLYALFYLLAALTGSAQTNLNFVDVTTLTTNIVVTTGTMTVPGIFTNQTYYTTNTVITQGDTLYNAFTKDGLNFIYLFNRAETNTADILALQTNTFGFTNTTTLPAGSSATVTNYGVIGGVAYFSLGIPAGPPGTNTVTNNINYYNLSNAVVSSQTYEVLNTNFNFALSNFIGKFTNIYSVSAIGPIGGGGGLAPPTSAATGILYSTNGTAFSPTFYTAPNVLWLSVTSSATGAGSVRVTLITHPEARGVTNDLTGQVTKVSDAVDPKSPPTLAQMQTAIANATSGLLSDGTWYYFSPSGTRLFEMKSPAMLYATNISFAIDGTGTNWALSLATNNFVPAWVLQMSTNLTYINGFQNFTNYTLTTNSGVATFTIPMVATPSSYAFFRIAAAQFGLLKSDYAHAFMGGIVSPSNTWDFVALTNMMASWGPGKHYWTGSSNGLADVKLSYSNGVVRYIRADY